MTWYWTEVRFSGRAPNAKDQVRINGLLEALDYDIPEATELGISGGWRHPSYELTELMSVLHAFGFACEGRWLAWDWSEEHEDEVAERLTAEPLTASEPDLSWVKRRDKEARDHWRRRGEKRLASMFRRRVRNKLLRFSRRFGRYL